MKVRLPKNGSSPKIQQLMMQAQKAQEEMEQASAKLESKEYIATSGGEAVKAIVSGKLEVKKIKIKPEIVDPEDLEILEDMISAAINEALKKASEEKDEVMQNISSKMNLPGMI